MKKILVPTDFSNNAEKALEYALHLAVHFNSEVLILHSWELPHQKSSMFANIQHLIRDKAEENLNELKLIIQDRFPEMKIQVKAGMGETSAMIKSVAKSTGADLIIMGTKGASGIKKIFMGSNTADVIDDAPCPVFVVPEDAEYRNIRNIGFATSLENVGREDLKIVADIAGMFNSKIAVIHISAEGMDEREKLDEFLNSLKQHFQNLSIEGMYGSGDNVVKQINQMIMENQIDVIAVVRQKRDFYEGLFHTSISKEISYSTKVPLIVLQGNEGN
jgi:nucleotide-binding universal stress UspA family protein